MVTRKRSAAVGLAVALFCASGVAAYAANESKNATAIDNAKPPIRFAVIAIQVPGLDLLTPYAAGADAAAAKINGMGGFGGRRVVIDTCNSMLSPAVATVCANQTLGKGDVAEFGCELAWSASGLALYGRKGVPSFNCTNNAVDFTYRWNFGIEPGGFGEGRGIARYLCTRSDVKRVVVFGADIPAQHANLPPQMAPVFQACGKTVDFVYAPLTTVDYSPYVNQALQDKPDFVIGETSGGAETVQLVKAFEQSGFPASKISIPSTSLDYTSALAPGGSALNGLYGTFEFKSWSDTSDPEVAAYLKAMKGSSVDPRATGPEWGYSTVMWFYTVAKQVGFAKFNSQTLAKFMREKTNVHIPLSRTLVNPGPAGYPEVKQPYVQIVQWKNGKMTPVKTGPNKDGWIKGY